MRLVVQRVNHAAVTVDGDVVGSIGHGLVILVGVTHHDTRDNALWLARKVASLRIFEDSQGKFNLSLQDIGGAALVISQFTLFGDTRRGRRPSFTDAARPEVAEPLIAEFADLLRGEGIPVETGIFGAYMLVEIHNVGPVTLILER
jgi:D-tyrosyl-tRNA(Tyr) deacylase